MKIISKEQKMAPIDICNSFEELYFEEQQVKMKRSQGQVRITDLSEAMKSGRQCRSYSLNDTEECGALNWLSSRSFDWPLIFAGLGALPWADRFREFDAIEVEGAKVYMEDVKAIRVYSPFNLAVIKPLKEEPKKWTLRHVLRALLNGQFKELRCDGQYSDDYAGDAARNFGRGEIANARAFARRIMESPSGWWTHSGENSVSVCCHHFDSNSFVFDLMGKA
ncbi:hypothetical protein SAMN02745165_02810 [Malonomonas rubra DSM 5091]|uniref:Uncharacterized protein n=1 Tax=Malonomonas rubra DSM 5091 TaxID=1122189 RepID=A0A1M6KV95_MALRU|nr:hypothetical protein [Malonomonas rubra]SHJ62887.1 hypothetical protein SAMN02745165_02810 [Malonomonas rubra DSM 5091]